MYPCRKASKQVKKAPRPRRHATKYRYAEESPHSLLHLLTHLYLGLVLYVDVAHVAVLAIRRLRELGQPKRHHLPAAAIDPVLAR